LGYGDHTVIRSGFGPDGFNRPHCSGVARPVVANEGLA